MKVFLITPYLEDPKKKRNDFFPYRALSALQWYFVKRGMH